VAPDHYSTLRAEVRLETKAQGSRFIGIAFPVQAKDDAAAALKAIKKQFFDATHHCYAYRLGPAGEQFRSSDDGEPGGTGGRPILAAIEHHGLSDVMVVVVRYFGGTKLGIPGLGRAYGQCAESVLQAAEPLERYAVDRRTITFPHDQTHVVMHLVSQYGAVIVDTSYDEDVHLAVEIRKSLTADLEQSLVERTAGHVTIAAQE
jgi:uncharacterized YigZ family protein